MKERSFSRREFGYLFIGSSLVAAGYSLRGFAQTKSSSARIVPTPESSLGPFYKSGAPKRSLLVEAGQKGEPLIVSGRVIDTSGRPLTRAVLEVFHADTEGQYDMTGFNCRGQIPIAADGRYSFETVMPGGYGGRAQHIHYRVSDPRGNKLITQLYFETDPKFGGDPDRNYLVDRLVEHRELIRPVTTLTRSGVTHRSVNFDICLVVS